jgi:hypothetical protein
MPELYKKSRTTKRGLKKMREREGSTNYYVNKQRSNVLIKGKINELIIGNVDSIHITKTIIEITETLPVSEKSVRERIEILVSINPRLVQVDDEIIYQEI